MTMDLRRASTHAAWLAAALLAGVVAVGPVHGVRGETEVDATESSSGHAAAILPIHGAITDLTVTSLSRRIAEARKRDVSVIVLDLDTPGGLVTSSIAVADLIKNLTDIKTVAWVNPNAYSGGTIVAVACDEIVMARSSRMGDSQVIMGGPGGVGAVPEDLRPKAYTPVLAEFRSSCRLNGYSQTLCEAFVLPDREVWWIESISTGERAFVFREEKIKRLKESDKPASKDDDEGEENEKDKKDEATDGTSAESAKDADAAAADWKLVEQYHDPVLDLVVATDQPIVRSDQLLQVSPGEAQAYGFSRAMIPDEDALRARFNLSTVVRVAPSWSESLAFWMTSIYVRGFLMVIILLGAYVEFHTPGVGVPGLVALICLAIFVGAPYLTGLANVWEVLFIVLGVLLIALEVFVIPGFGIAGISGVALLIVGLLATFVQDDPGRSFPLYFPTLPGAMYHVKMAFLTLVSATGASIVGMIMLSKFLPRMPFFGRIVPPNPIPSEVQTADSYRGMARVGDIGESVGPLRPAGKARLGGMLVDVVTQGDYIEAGVRLEIIEHRGNQVVVRSVA
ncbi:MAG: nodulation protein NfeD [Phycisphaerae bacterium]